VGESGSEGKSRKEERRNSGSLLLSVGILSGKDSEEIEW
jgi:hypothetical protein